MLTRIADTLLESLRKLNANEQKAVKQTVFDLQADPSGPGLSFHKLDRAKDKRFWSVRVTQDIRLIVHRSESNLLLCYVDHHDKAYEWAERRKIERHPKTGAAQIVEIRETVREIEVPKYVESADRVMEDREVSAPVRASRPLFADRSNDELLGYGVPEEWVDDVKSATEETLFELADHLPGEASEALLELATGGAPEPVVVADVSDDPFGHPDSQRRFRVMTNIEELERALEYPWEKWTVFLHPSQRNLVERSFNGPARVAGSAGTGKTVVALHRAVHLARADPSARVLLTTFSPTLARSLAIKIRRLLGEDSPVLERMEVRSLDQLCVDLYTEQHGEPQIATSSMLRMLLKRELEDARDCTVSLSFLEAEWRDVVDAWQLQSWESYRDVRRLGRKTRLGEKQRAVLWEIFSGVRASLKEQAMTTVPGIYSSVTTLAEADGMSPFKYIVADEAQDISVPQLKLLGALARDEPNALFFSGDLGQRIFQTPFSWKSLGVDVRGRSKTLRINYRTSHQIRMQADRLLPDEIADVDGNKESRSGTVSVFNSPPPVIYEAADRDDEAERVSGWTRQLIDSGVAPHEVGVIVRSPESLERASETIRRARQTAYMLDGTKDHEPGYVAVSTMHMAKGLEFRAVAVIACDDDVLPSQARIESVTDMADLEDVYDTERHLLYVACTRARESLLVSGVAPVSEFIGDMVT